MSFRVEIAGRFAREAAALGEGEVCARFRRSFYLRYPGGRFACVGDASLGHGPLNALASGLVLPALGAKISVTMDSSAPWEPPRRAPLSPPPELLKAARIPEQGLGCRMVGAHNALSAYAQPALDALQRWLAGDALGAEAERLVGLGPGLTPSGDDYLGGMLIALRALGRGAQADALWRWLEPRLAGRTSAISAAHLAAAAAGQAHEALHEVLSGSPRLERLDAVGHCSGWDGLAGALAALGAFS